MLETVVIAGHEEFDRPATAQATFRSVMNALAHPTRIYPLPLREAVASDDLGGLHRSSAALLLALADFETSIWLGPAIAGPRTCEMLRFATGARIIEAPGEADFVVISATQEMPPLTTYKSGTPEYPDRSVLVVVQIRSFEPRDQNSLTFAGPGIVDRAALRIDPWPPNFSEQWRINRAGFPCGVDLVFAAPDAVTALPRSARLTDAR